MAKDPAFLFYSQDFITGTQFFTDEQLGKYIRLLCAQHQHGHLSEVQVNYICRTLDPTIMKKFKQDTDGLFFNERLDNEIKKRKSFCNSRRENITKRYKEKESYISSTCVDHMYIHMENENENENINRKGGVGEKPKWAENFKNFNPEIKYAFESEKFGAMWDYWLKYKRERKDKKYTTTGEQATIKGLYDKAEGSIDNAGEIINQSIQQNWAGLFEVKHHQNNAQVTDLAKTGRVLN